MKRIHIIGRKNHGKTTLVFELVRELQSRGLRVGTIKHTHHHHELDTPGKDSHLHREAGAVVSGVYSRTMTTVFWPPNEPANTDAEPSESSDAKYAAFAPMFSSCDIVIVEGDSHTQATKLEVWRKEVSGSPLAASDATIAVVITDDNVDQDMGTPIWPRSDVKAIATKILQSRTT